MHNKNKSNPPPVKTVWTHEEISQWLKDRQAERGQEKKNG